jgi:ABC-type multidrug transport system ATPase subunit
MKESVVELTDIHLRAERGGFVFRGLNLTIESGQSAVIIGPSGSGKSTLAELLIGLRRADQGRVCLFGREVKKHREFRRVRRHIGGVGGPFALVPSLTVAENISLPLVLNAEPRNLQRERLFRILSEFSLLKLAGRYPDHLTRVENTLVQFARAAIANQPLMLIDEPSAGLDPANYQRVTEFLVRMAVSGQSLLILASQTPPGEIPGSRAYFLRNEVLE